jgi:hypothetical protein
MFASYREDVYLLQKWHVIFALPLVALCLSSTHIVSLAFASPDTSTPSNSVNNSSTTTSTATNAKNLAPPASGDNNNMTSSPSPNGIVTIGKPLFREHIIIAGANPVNQTFTRVSLVGNGTLVGLANSTLILNTNSTGWADVNYKTTSAIGREILTAGEDKDNATLTFYEITRHNVQARTEKGVVIGVFYTNSTGKLASLDGTIGVGTADVDSNADTDITLWEYNTGIQFVKNWMELLMMPVASS